MSPVTFWGVFDVEVSAALKKEIALRIPSNTSFTFYDNFGDHSDARPAVVGSFPTPIVILTNNIIPIDSQPWDFYLRDIDYDQLPISIATNENFPVARLFLYADTEDPNAQIWKKVEGKLTGVNIAAFKGISYLYKDANGNSIFDDSDTFIASNAVDGANFSINLSWSNATTDRFSPDVYFVSMKVTNKISFCSNTRFAVQITNLVCEGPSSGLFANQTLLTNLSSTSRIDNRAVTVVSISNIPLSYYIKQGSFNQPFLRIGLKGNDPDGTNYLSSIKISTNSLTTVSSTHIPALKIYYDANGDGLLTVSNGIDTQLVGANFTLSGTTLTLSPPLPIFGTALKTLIVAFDVSSDDNTAKGKNLGLKIGSDAFTFSDIYNDGFPQNGFVVGNVTGPSTPTNISISALTSRVWDYRVLSASVANPLSLALSNNIIFSKVELVADGESAAEKLTNVEVTLKEGAPDAKGIMRLYLDTNYNGVPDNFESIKTVPFVGTALNYNLSVDLDSEISLDSLSPSLFILSLEVTNNFKPVFTNRLSAAISKFSAIGPNSGLVTNDFLLGTIPSTYTRIDEYKMFISGATHLTNSLKQGDFAKYLSLRLTNSDPDAVYSLSSLKLTNQGTAQLGDLGSFQIYRDNNDGEFNSALDTLVGSANYTTSNTYVVRFNPPLEISGTNTLLWGLSFINFSATPGRTISLKIPTPSSSVVFTDGVSDSYNFVPSMTIGVNLPTNVTTNVIIPFTAQPYDFYAHSVNFEKYPRSFTAGTEVNVGTLALFMDNEQPSLQKITNLKVSLSSTGSKNNVYGIARLYKNTTNFTPGNVIASVPVVAGGNLSIPLSLSNLSIIATSPDKLYLTFTLTNNIESAKNNKLSFSFSNALCTGPNGGIFTNFHNIKNIKSVEANIDSYRVIVTSALNSFLPAEPRQTSMNNRYMQVVLRSDDLDVTNYINSIDVVTNNLSTMIPGNGDIPYIKIFGNNNKLLSTASFDDGKARLTLTTPIALPGTNNITLSVMYDVSPAQLVVGKRFGMKITNGGFGFIDHRNDGYVRNIWVDSFTQWPATPSYVTIQSFDIKPWDFSILRSAQNPPIAMALSNEYPLYYFDVYRDDSKSETAIALTNVDVVLSGLPSATKGVLGVRRGNTTQSDFLLGTIVTNSPFDASVLTNRLFFFQNFIKSERAENFDRFWITAKITNAPSGIFTNRMGAKVVNVLAKGLSQTFITNVYNLTNFTPKTARIDDYKLIANVFAEPFGTRQEGSSVNKAFAIELVNLDKDSEYFLSGLSVTNKGSATASDLGAFRLFRDTGNLSFDSANDIQVMNANYNGTTRRYQLSSFTPISLPFGTNLFFGSYDINFGAATTNQVVLEVATSSSFLFVKNPNSTTDDFAKITNEGPWGSFTNNFSAIGEDAFAIYAKGVNYNISPMSITTNDPAALASITLFKGYRKTDEVALTKLFVETSSVGIKNNIYGIVSLVKETNSSLYYSPNNCTLIAETNIKGGSNFNFSFYYTDITRNQYQSDKLYVVLKVTNGNLDAVKHNQIAFQISGITATNIVNTDYSSIANSGVLSATPIRDTAIDSRYVNVLAINKPTDAEFLYPNQGSTLNQFLHIQMRGEDPSFTNYLSSLLITLDQSTFPNVTSGQIPYIQVYTNENYVGAQPEFLRTAPFSITSSNSGGLLSFSGNGFALPGTNLVNLYISYDVSSSNSVIDKKVSFMVPPNAFTFKDGLDDNFPQLTRTKGVLTGPSPNTNAFIVRSGAQPWDIYLTRFKGVYEYFNPNPLDANKKTPIANVGKEIPIYSLDLYRENQSPSNQEYVSGFVLSNLSRDQNFSGTFKVYKAKAGASSYSGYPLVIPSVSVDQSMATIDLLFSSNYYITDNPADADQFIITYTPLSFNSAATNHFVVDRILCGGFNNGVVANTVLIENYQNYPILLEGATILFDINTVAPETAKQGQKEVPFLAFSVTSTDNDAVYYLDSLTFLLSGTAQSTDFERVYLYADNGNANFDSSDTLIPGAAAVFQNGRAKVVFTTAQSISSTPKKFVLVGTIADLAEPLRTIKISLPENLQEGVIPIPGYGENIEINLNTTGVTESSICTIEPLIVFQDQVAVSRSIIDLSKGEQMGFYIDDALPTFEGYTIKIFDVSGSLLRELFFKGYSVLWDGKAENGEILPSGMYIALIEGPGNYKKRTKVMVVQ